ncbi:MAG: outer membrane protein assembly factor BamE [Stagnimonas sp.]|nr:outer membrane protein assembly factor BamE [Stagnimonas sp.]
MTKTEISLIAGVALLLAGCATPRLAPDAHGVSFPARESSYRHQGVVLLPEAARQVWTGMDKDQVRQILGNPHFTEGLFFVKDWNYLITLLTPQGDRLDCQLQLQFDDAGKVTLTHWQTEPCSAAASRPALVAASEPLAPVAATSTPASGSESLSLHGLLFPFARSTLEDLPAKDLDRLEQFASGIGARVHRVLGITIHGHSDRVGPPERREQRSLSRAQAVAEVFVRHGIDRQRITIVARSATEPLVSCPEGMPYPQLLGCLAPDRRVTIAVRLAGD